MKKEFTDESYGQKSSTISKLEPKMLPVRFRERVALNQRLFIALIVLLYSAAVGVVMFTLIDGLATKMMGVYKDKDTILIITIVVSLAALFTGMATPLWSRNRKLLFSLTETILLLLSPIIYIGGFIYLNASFNYTSSDPKKLLFMIGLITLASNAIPIALNFVKTLINIKRYKNSFIKGLFIAPGNLIVASSNMVFWLLIKLVAGSLKLDSSTIYATAGTFIGGLGFMITGLMISLKWDIRGTKSIWSGVRVTGALPAMMVYTTLAVIGIEYIKLDEFPMPVILTLAADFTLIIGLSIYVWFRGGIKNLIKTNPIYNNVVLRVFVIMVASIGLVMVSIMPDIALLKNYGPPSFTILVITSVSVLIGVAIAHIGKIIIYTKFFKAIIVGSFLTLLLTLLIIMSIIVLKRSEVVLAIISRQIVSIFLVFAIISEVLILSLDLSVTIIKMIQDTKKQKKEDKQTEESQTEDVKNVKVKGAK